MAPLKAPHRWVPAGFFCAILAVIIIMQVSSGALGAELSDPDEPAHYLTGLFVHDYLAKGLPAAPMAYAIDYYVHYPKVALGHWPPFFHMLEAAWMFVAPDTPRSVVILIALLMAALSTLLFRAERSVSGTPAAIALGFFLVLLPTPQYGLTRIAADVPVAVLAFWAALRWGRYLERERSADALACALLSGLCMLTKGNGLALLPLPFVSTALAGRLHLFRARAFWQAITLMTAMGLSWQFFALAAFRNSVTMQVAPMNHLVAHVGHLLTEAGVGVAFFALVGCVVTVRGVLRRDAGSGLGATMVSFLGVWVIFHAGVPLDPEARFLLAVIPALLWLAARGVAAAAARAGNPGSTRYRSAVIAVSAVLVAWFFATSFTRVTRRHYGYAEIAEALSSHDVCPGCALLTSSEREGDGMLISEMAARDRRPNRFVVRADKVLSRSTWDGDKYELLYDAPDAISRYLADVPIAFVVLDRQPGVTALAHHRLLTDVVQRHSADWTLVNQYPAGSTTPTIEVYRSTHPLQHAPVVVIDMSYSLGRTIKAGK